MPTAFTDGRPQLVVCTESAAWVLDADCLRMGGTAPISGVCYLHQTDICIRMNYGCALLADCHPPMLEAMRSLIHGLFESVVMVTDEASLLRAVEQLKPDLVLVDVSFPLAGRVNVVSLLRERHPELKVIAVSVHDEPVVAERVAASGASGFVLKRSAHSDLTSAVHEVLAGRSYVSPGVGVRRTLVEDLE